MDGWNWVTVILIAVLGLSVLQGAKRGAAGSSRRLLALGLEGAGTAISILVAWRLVQWASPRAGDWLVSLGIAIPSGELNVWQQLYYTFVTSLRDFSLMRGAILFAIVYIGIKGLLNRIALPLLNVRLDQSVRSSGDSPASRWASAAVGGAIGVATGAVRGLLVIAALMVVAVLFPDSPVSGQAAKSPLYRQGAERIIAPLTGNMLSRLPVFTQSVQAEFDQILKRKYEVLDAHVPEDVASAALEITAGKETDEDKARALYQWVGTRVKYDWDKVRLYEEKRIWKEQTPEDTFLTRAGVCIDYSRLYAAMARSVGLDVKVVTGLGSDGRGGTGSHAWNEVYLSEKQTWVPLDSTWVSSGGNWFDSADFYKTHIKEAYG
ncbi:transglutaminase domain-containing protein [Paenibacillus sp. YN15]|uniref:transglutaminase domain-containing protein n=1 Tax=Paenibacillus sp. YN15 TaxID=1742774 RepID=UPI000DCCFA9C|nr:transglutaminase domain-containing protein [Paenibacillus sp. YN15]RAV00574.1 transglutaminase domain-containing protein [Paenibacillus sp. YN15]